MPVLEPVVATLVANTEVFTAKMVAAKAEMKGFATETALVGDAAGAKLAAGLGAGASGVGQAEKDIKGVETAVKDVGTAAEHSGGKFSLFGAALNQVGGPLGEIRGKTNEYTGGIKEAASQSGGLVGALASIPTPVLAVGAAVGAVGAFSLQMAKDLGSSTKIISANMGISKADAKSFTDEFVKTSGHVVFTAAEIGKAFGDYSGQVKELNHGNLNATQGMQFMDAAMAAAEATHSSLGSTVSTLAKTMQGFGLGTKDTTMVADSMTVASRMTGTSITQLGTAMARAHSTMGAAAPSLQEMSALIVDLSEHGITGRQAIGVLGSSLGGLAAPTDKVIAEQKRLGISFLDSQGKLQPMSQVIETAKGAIGGMNQQQAISELKMLGFGSGAKKLYATIEDGSKAYDRAKDKVSEHGAAGEAAHKMTSGFGSSLTRVKAALENAGAVLGGTFTPLLSKMAMKLANAVAWVTDHWPEIMAIIKKGVDFVKPAFEVLGKAIEATFKWLIEHKPILIAVLSAIGIAIGVAFFPFTAIAIGIIALVALIIKAWEPVKNFFIKIWEAIYDSFKPIIPLLKAGMDYVIGIFKIGFSILEAVFTVVWDTILAIVKVVWNIISGYIKVAIAIFTGNWGAAWNAIKGMFIGVWNAIKDFVIQVWNAIKNFFVGAFNTFKSMWKGVWNGISDFLSSIWGKITGIFTGAIKWLYNAGSDILTGLWHGMTGVWNDITGWFGKLPGWILNALGDVGGWLYNVGGDVIRGLGRGLVDFAQSTIGHIPIIGGKIVQMMKDALGIKSPSTVMYEIGKNTMLGLANGISDHAGLAHNAMANVGLGLSPAASMNISGGVSSLNVGNGATSTTTLHVTTPIQIDGRTLATTVTQYQLQNARSTGTVLGQYSGGSQTGAATGLNTNAISR
jgi:TP901 family phage tail tape measure protein